MNVDNPEQLPTVISFCSGYAGIERGLELAGIEHRVLAYVEIESFAIANLVAKMEQGQLVPAPIWTNLKTFPAHLFRDSVDIITGGYPCQPFSVAGRATTTKESFSDPRHLFPYILNHVRTIRPSQCFFENVEGHINRGLESVLQDLEGAGYRSTWGIFSAEEVGAPHQRKRIFILGNAKHHGLASSEIRRGIEETSDNNEGWKSEASKSQGASEREVNGDLCGEKISPSISKRKQSVVNPDSSLRLDVRQQISEQGKKTQQRIGDSSGSTSEELANSDSFRSQRVRSNEHQEGRQRQEERPTGLCSGTEIWDVEPNVGRVAHGIADRVDRLRLLGNGVVPQTAARAWEVLNGRV